MHVALFTPAWPPGIVANGIVTYVNVVRAELLARGHRVSLFSPALHAPEPDAHAVNAGTVERVAGALAARLQPRRAPVYELGKTIASTIARVHAKDPIDIIEMEESFGWVGEVAARLQMPVVCKLHGPAFLTMVTEELETEFGQEKVRREGEALGRLPVIVAPSRHTLSATIAHYKLDPAVAERIVNPIDSSAATSLWDSQSCDRNMVLFVGRFDKIKGGDLAVLAFQRALALRPNLRLSIVGPDPGLQGADGGSTHLHEFVASLGDPALAAAIRWHGPLDPRSVAQMRPRAAVTLVPSRQESQGYTALEAMLQACPVVCADTSGLRETIGHEVTGLKARSEDPQDLALQMERILDDPSLGRSLGLAGRDYVIKHHAPSTVVTQLLDLYRRAIALRRSGAAAGH